MNVEMLPKEDETLYTLENVAPKNVTEDDVEDVLSVETYISKLHLTNLEKHHAAWKFYNCNSPMWVFLKVNNN